MEIVGHGLGNGQPHALRQTGLDELLWHPHELVAEHEPSAALDHHQVIEFLEPVEAQLTVPFKVRRVADPLLHELFHVVPSLYVGGGYNPPL